MRFARILGRTPKAEIMRVRMDHARKLLAQADSVIPAVARSTGFANAREFATSFRKYNGLTPTQFRRNSRLATTIAQ